MNLTGRHEAQRRKTAGWLEGLSLSAALMLSACGGGGGGGGAATPTSAPRVNHAPSLSGTPASVVDTGAHYDFLPTAYDADGDILRFTISGKPAWASFDPASGRLSGTPKPGQVGGYADIVITASDGQTSTSLPAFQIQVTGTATLSWTAPTQNMDTSALTDLAGYRVYAWKRDGTRLAVDPITDIAELRLFLGGLSAGTWFFAVSAFNAAGIESNFSNIGSKTIY